MDRYAKENAVGRINGYYNPQPHEVALENQVEAFHRAQQEAVARLREAMEQTAAVTVEDFFQGTGRGLLLQSIRGELKGSVGKHDWCVDKRTDDGYLVHVDDRPVSYRPTPHEAKNLALEIIARCDADGGYRLSDKPAGFSPPETRVQTLVTAIPDQCVIGRVGVDNYVPLKLIEKIPAGSSALHGQVSPDQDHWWVRHLSPEFDGALDVIWPARSIFANVEEAVAFDAALSPEDEDKTEAPQAPRVRG